MPAAKQAVSLAAAACHACAGCNVCIGCQCTALLLPPAQPGSQVQPRTANGVLGPAQPEATRNVRVCLFACCVQASRLVKLVQSTSLSEATWLQLSSTWQSHSTTITALTAAAATAGESRARLLLSRVSCGAGAAERRLASAPECSCFSQPGCHT